MQMNMNKGRHVLFTQAHDMGYYLATHVSDAVHARKLRDDGDLKNARRWAGYARYNWSQYCERHAEARP